MQTGQSYSTSEKFGHNLMGMNIYEYCETGHLKLRKSHKNLNV